MTKTLMKEILNDDEKLADYITSLEEDINNTSDIDDKIDSMLNNIIELTDNFKDRRALKASLIDSVAGLIKIKSELPEKRIKTKKTILDIMTKKQELEIKNKQAQMPELLNGQPVGNTFLVLLNKLDSSHVYPERLSEIELNDYKILDSENINENNIIETNIEKVVKKEESNNNTATKQIEILPNKINIVDIQNTLDSNSSEVINNG